MKHLMILRIEEKETKIFQTKTKTNFTLTFQMVKPEEFLMRNSWALSDNIEKRIKNKCTKLIKDLVKTDQTPRLKYLKSMKMKSEKQRNEMKGSIQSMIRNSTKNVEDLNKELNLKKSLHPLIVEKDKVTGDYVVSGENKMTENWGREIPADLNCTEDSLMLGRKRSNTVDLFNLSSFSNSSFIIPSNNVKEDNDFVKNVMIREGVIDKSEKYALV